MNRVIAMILSLAMLILVYSQTLLWLTGSWIYNSYYSHGFIVLAVSVYLGYRIAREKEVSPYIDIFGIYIIAISLFIHVLASFWEIEFLSAVSLLTAIFGITTTFYGYNSAKKLAFPIFFILLAIPFPIYDITNVLEVLSAQATTAFVNFLGIKATNIGAEIQLKSCNFIVGAPCSGIRAIVSLLTVGTLYGYLINEKLWLKAILVVLTIPLALVANILRISSIIVMAGIYGKDVALGFFHYASDLTLFIIAVIMLMLSRRCMHWLISRQHS
ncbi:MAG: exosortase/archaeosortase family protein [Archaeoglobus sp.]|nr:exosortase/archaeosortase family protein [Archaeoglobus sp.]